LRRAMGLNVPTVLDFGPYSDCAVDADVRARYRRELDEALPAREGSQPAPILGEMPRPPDFPKVGPENLELGHSAMPLLALFAKSEADVKSERRICDALGIGLSPHLGIWHAEVLEAWTSHGARESDWLGRVAPLPQLAEEIITNRVPVPVTRSVPPQAVRMIVLGQVDEYLEYIHRRVGAQAELEYVAQSIIGRPELVVRSVAREDLKDATDLTQDFLE